MSENAGESQRWFICDLLVLKADVICFKLLFPDTLPEYPIIGISVVDQTIPEKEEII